MPSRLSQAIGEYMTDQTAPPFREPPRRKLNELGMTDQTAPLFTREQLRLKFNELGYPLTASYFQKICLPSVNAGPPVAKWWGRRPLYHLEGALAWAESRYSSSPGKLVD
jgi:hypothetical protein